MTASWDIVPYSLLEVDRHFRCAHCLHHQVYFNDSTWRYIPESCHLHTWCHENLKSHINTILLHISVLSVYFTIKWWCSKLLWQHTADVKTNYIQGLNCAQKTILVTPSKPWKCWLRMWPKILQTGCSITL
jgi:hypothetical protein